MANVTTAQKVQILVAQMAKSQCLTTSEAKTAAFDALKMLRTLGLLPKPLLEMEAEVVREFKQGQKGSKAQPKKVVSEFQGSKAKKTVSKRKSPLSYKRRCEIARKAAATRLARNKA